MSTQQEGMRFEFEPDTRDAPTIAGEVVLEVLATFAAHGMRVIDEHADVVAARSTAIKTEPFEIVDKMSAQNGSACLAIIKAGIETIKSVTDAYVRPVRLSTDTMRGEMNAKRDELKGAFDSLNDKLIEWRNAEEVMANDVRERAQKAAQQVVDEANADKPPEEHVPAVEVYVPRPPTTFGSPQGQTIVKRPWKFDIIDAKMVPAEYHLDTIDMTRVRAAVRAGVRHIPGVRIYRGNETAIRLARAVE